jgi:hypothetical protein
MTRWRVLRGASVCVCLNRSETHHLPALRCRPRVSAGRLLGVGEHATRKAATLRAAILLRAGVDTERIYCLSNNEIQHPNITGLRVCNKPTDGGSFRKLFGATNRIVRSARGAPERLHAGEHCFNRLATRSPLQIVFEEVIWAQDH